MSETTAAAMPPVAEQVRLDPRKAGMLTFLVSEVAFFSTLIMTYVVFLGRTTTPPTPTPAEVLSLTLVGWTTACLLASSGTVHLADRALRHQGGSGFVFWWTATILLGALFLAGTGCEWYDLIYHKNLTIGINMFGSTFYTLVGFHAAHVTIGVLTMTILLTLALRGQVTTRNAIGVELMSWYWHFVDAVWIVVFTLVYVVGR